MPYNEGGTIASASVMARSLLQRSRLCMVELLLNYANQNEGIVPHDPWCSSKDSCVAIVGTTTGTGLSRSYCSNVLTVDM
jgi:hypothetical protein